MDNDHVSGIELMKLTRGVFKDKSDDLNPPSNPPIETYDLLLK